MPPRPIILRGRGKLLEPVVSMFMGIYQLLESRDIGTIYGAPSTVWQSERKFKPQILLYFKEDPATVATGDTPCDGRISFRLMEDKSTSITKGELTTIATKIKELFITGGGYKWDKGKIMCTYTDWSAGYQFQLLCKNESDGRELVKKLLAIQSHVPQWKKFAHNENDAPLEAYPEVPGKVSILGELEDKPVERPLKTVRFQYAVLHLHGRKNPVALCDRTNKLKDPLV